MPLLAYLCLLINLHYLHYSKYTSHGQRARPENSEGFAIRRCIKACALRLYRCRGRLHLPYEPAPPCRMSYLICWRKRVDWGSVVDETSNPPWLPPSLHRHHHPHLQAAQMGWRQLQRHLAAWRAAPAPIMQHLVRPHSCTWPSVTTRGVAVLE